MINLITFVENTKSLTHINLSGMNFNRENLVLVANSLANSKTLLAVHLNDN